MRKPPSEPLSTVRPAFAPARLLRLALVLLPLVCAVRPASAEPAAPSPPVPDPPYEQKLERLAEILGALHYLRGLCVPAEAQIWRQEMAQLIEVEAPGPDRRDRLVQAFNRGQSAFRESYRTCTAAATLAADRYREEGLALSREISSRFAD